METKECLKRIVNSLCEQGFVFSKGVKVYATNQALLQSNSEHFSEPFDLNSFQGDMHWIAQHLPEVALFPWRCKAPRPIFYHILGETQGLMSVVGIVLIPDLSQINIKSVFSRFDEVVLNMLRKYNTCNSDNAVTFGTLLFLFEHSEDAQIFNSTIRKNYSAHAFKNTFISTISIDCETETLTQGRAGLCFKWNGGIDVPKLKENVFNGICENNALFDRMINDVDETDSSSVVAIKEAIKLNMIISEMEKTINELIPNANFKYPKDYLEYEAMSDTILKPRGWFFPKGSFFIREELNRFQRAYGISNLIPFASNNEDGNEEPTEYACFLIDGINNSKVVTICPFGSADNFCQDEYEDINKWFHTEMVACRMKGVMTLQGKPKCLGLDLIDGACGPLIAIPKQLLKGHRLVMTTDAGVWYAENDRIKDTVEKYGCGLRVQSVSAIEHECVEAIMEVIEGGSPNPICVDGVEVNLPADAYILATPFAGEFFVKLEAEDANGNREFLWGDDYIYK